jgi:hypothetical protein
MPRAVSARCRVEGRHGGVAHLPAVARVGNREGIGGKRLEHEGNVATRREPERRAG